MKLEGNAVKTVTVYTVTLELTEVELKDLYTLYGKVTGSQEKSGRRTSDSIYDARGRAFPEILAEYYGRNADGNVKFKDDNEVRP